MIVLRVLSYNGAPVDGPQAQFDELGGTIGRADNNQLVLPDPERTISRVHARIVFRSGAYAVVDNGSNPISVNGLPVGTGREQPLGPGDQLQIGGYVIGASAAAAAASDPFADLFGDTGGLATPSAPARPLPAAMWPAPPPPVPGSQTARAAAAPPSGVLAPGHIPDDWDPFAPEPASPAPVAGAGLDPFADLPVGGGQSLDALFGLSGMPAGDPLADPLADRQPRTATLMRPTPSDHASDLNTPMPRPQVQAPAPSPGPAPAPAPAPLPPGAVFSWEDPPRDGRIVTLPGVRRSNGAGTPGDAPAAPSSSSAPPAPPSPTEVELLGGLLQGLGTPGLRLSALTPDTLQLVGQLLRESIRGAVELLVARAALKREMRADVTMIVARQNNPLKFSPTVEVALQHLLGPPAPGFMPAAAAVRDAFDDLRAHQLGVMAGMRAALDGVLGRFDPAQLEAKLTHRSAINSLIPATRKARLWESFQELFAQLQAEAQDDFDELFGKAFLRAYEDQLDRLQREQDAPR